MVKDDKKDKRKEMKVVKEIKSKIKIVGERDESELEEDIEESNKGRIGQRINNGREISEMANVGEFKAPSIILEASAAEEPRAEIKQATKERQEFEKEEAVRERLYGNGRGGQGGRGQRTGRDSYESAYYAAGGGTGGTAPNLFRERAPAVQQIRRKEAVRGAAIEQNTQIERGAGVGEREDRYQAQQGQQGQQRRRRYPWEA